MGFMDNISVFERRELFIAWLCLAIAFTFALSGGIRLITGSERISINVLVVMFIIALATVGLSFVFHELAHKFTAIKFGYWAEFRKSTQMLLVAIVVAVVTGIVFAAPGATLINTAGREMSKKENGIISVAGPLINIILVLPFIAVLFAGIIFSGGNADLLNNIFTLPGFLVQLGMVGFMVNAMLAFFNMLPVGPLDGRKILAWNPVIFILVILVSIVLLFVAMQPELLIGVLLNP